jgi:hypothetical protein
MSKPTTITELARKLKIKPRTISDLFYQQELDNDRCPRAGRGRSIPADYVPEIVRVLKTSGKLPK